MTNRPTTLKLSPTDAAIILKSDGSCEVSLPDVHGDPIPENIIMSAALIYALQDSHLCDLIHTHFQEKCAEINEEKEATVTPISTMMNR